MGHVTGIVLAAGGGTRAGGPKASRRTPDGTAWIAVSTTMLLSAGCPRVVVVLGAGEHLARPLVPSDPRVTVAVANDWERGMSASLRTGIAASTGVAALVTLVDLPDLPESVARRVLGAGVGADALRQATFDSRPGHPVLIGAAHWDAVSRSLEGDRGARDYLMAHGVLEVECGDLTDGADVDLPPADVE